MPVTLLNPDGMMKPELYHQVSIASGSRQVHIAGQVAYDAAGKLVARGDLAGQVAQSLRNVGIALAAAGATFSDVVRLRFYVVGWRPEQISAFGAGVQQVARELEFVPAPASLIGVSVLFEPDILVEVEATAILP